MGYALTTGQQAPLIDQDSNPIADGSAFSITFAVDGIATLGTLDGNITVKAQAVGEVDVTVTPDGSTGVTHTVTVNPQPFDWTLGDPVPA